VTPPAAVTPTPNSGAADELDPPESPDVSLRAEGIGIAYCFPAGDPGSVCTPELGPPAATATPVWRHTKLKIAAINARIPTRTDWRLTAESEL
jgi:hypothetical protein